MRNRLLRALLPIALLLSGQVDQAAETDRQGAPLPGKISWSNKKHLTADIDRIAQKHQVEPALVHAVISAESGYDPRAVSPKGAIGLMQVLPETARDYGVESVGALFDPIVNLTIGTRHLRRLLMKYRNISHALAAYNAGEGATGRYRRAVPYLETRKYVVRVINFYWHYKGG